MPYLEPTTLGELRTQLVAKDIPAPTAEQMAAATAAYGRERILAALKTLQGDPGRAQGARAFLNRCFPAGPPSPQVALDSWSAATAAFDPLVAMDAAGNPATFPGDSAPARPSKHVYGGRAALCFEASLTRRGIPTVTMDAAAANAPKTYDWKNKLSIQFTVDELPVVLAVFLGIIPSCHFMSHGPRKDKGFQFELQDQGKIFVKVFSSEGVRALPIGRPDAFQIARLLLAQLKASNHGLNGVELITLLRTIMTR